jgi:PAS domain S-box-containing protein
MGDSQSPRQHGKKMEWKTGRHLVLWGFAAATIILIFAGWESYRNTARLIEAAEARKSSYEFTQVLDEVEARLVDAETGQRGYLLTGDETYLESYHAASKNLDQVLARLKELTSDNPKEQEQVQSMGVLIENKLGELQRTIDFRRNPEIAGANQLVLEGSGMRWMDQIRSVIAEMKHEGYGLRKIRNQQMSKIAVATKRTIIVGCFLSLSLLVFVLGLLERELGQRRQAQLELGKSEKLLATTLASIGDAVITTDMNGAVTFMNPVAQSLTGWNLAEAQGKSMDLVFDIVSKETRNPVENPIKKVFREGKVVGLADHTVLISRNGKEFEIEDSAAPIVTDAGEGLGVVLVFRDITELKRAEHALKQSEERFRLLVSGVKDYAIFMLDVDGRVASWNAGAERLKGHQAEEIIGQPFSRFYTPDDIVQNKPGRELRVAAAEGWVEDEGWRVRKDGSQFWANVVITALRNKKGELIGFSKITRDVTERKRDEDKFRAFLESAPDATVIVNREGKIVLINAQTEKMFGYTRGELIGEAVEILLPAHFRAQHTVHRDKFFDEPRARSMGAGLELFGVHKNGSEIPVEISLSPIRTGKDFWVSAAIRDITERKQIQVALTRAKEEAERSNKFKDQFLSTMSHELRTPLNAVLGFSDLLTEERYGPLNDRQRRYVTHIHTGGKHLLRLINDILDLSKIEAGRLQLTIESVPIDESFAEVTDTLRALADKKSQSLVVNSSADLSVRADTTRFKQILMNLLGNAIKFTPEGGEIQLTAQDLGEEIRVEVRDSGPGIPTEEQQAIFEAFYRLRQSEKGTEGTGLGLAITRRLVELHGGQLGLESEPGRGSCFYFTLPSVTTFVKGDPRDSGPGNLKHESARILVIEDDPAAAHLLQSHLVSAGYQVLVCDHPQGALEMAAEFQPSAMTLDILMKPVNGWEILPTLKSDPRTSKIPVIVVTVVDQPATGVLLGADEYIVKPVDKATLLSAVERCLSQRGRRGRSRPILVVEDDAPTREFVAELLSKHGYLVGTAADGAEARARVAASLPELVILDLILPEVSGFQLLAEWRIDSRTADLPIFVLTSKDLTVEEKSYIRKNTEALFQKQEHWQEALIQQLQRAVPVALTEKR